jgi:hypothetical protein
MVAGMVAAMAVAALRLLWQTGSFSTVSSKRRPVLPTPSAGGGRRAASQLGISSYAVECMLL